jgi:hypothetical protein
MTDDDTTEPAPREESQKDQMLRYLYWGGFVGLCLAGVFAAGSFYLSAMTVIDIWVAAEFEPVFSMLFNLAVVLVAALCLSVLLRRFDIVLGESESQ